MVSLETVLYSTAVIGQQIRFVETYGNIFLGYLNVGLSYLNITIIRK